SSREKTGGRFFSNCSKKIVSDVVLPMLSALRQSFAYHIGMQLPDGERLMQPDKPSATLLSPGDYYKLNILN
ncbi:hypothetical protein, partial [Desulfovibrio sp.]|uniref:hypothetical protein n=1 Tax=Desulfovibrio sp. TaxID=885 RepID=UPI0025C1235C